MFVGDERNTTGDTIDVVILLYFLYMVRFHYVIEYTKITGKNKERKYVA